MMRITRKILIDMFVITLLNIFLGHDRLSAGVLSLAFWFLFGCRLSLACWFFFPLVMGWSFFHMPCPPTLWMQFLHQHFFSADLDNSRIFHLLCNSKYFLI